MKSSADAEYLLGDCNWKGEYIIHQTDFKEKDIKQNPATTCNSNRIFNGFWSLRIHKTRWCNQRNSLMEECKSNDGVMNLDLHD